MIWKTDFFVGYSPERINPGDKERTLTKIIKIVAEGGGDRASSGRIANLPLSPQSTMQ